MRLIRPGGTGAPSKAVAPVLARQRARDAAIERSRASYIRLACGPKDDRHVTTWEAHVAYSVWKPKGKDEFCEHCGRWVKRAPKPKAAVYPDDPLF